LLLRLFAAADSFITSVIVNTLINSLEGIQMKGTSRLKRFGEKQGSLRVTIPPEIWKEAEWRDGDLVLFETQLDGSVIVKKI